MDANTRALTLERAARAVAKLRVAAIEAEHEFAMELDGVAPSLRPSARNLAHYLAVRRHDVRDLQDQLERLGLSSLGRMEAHVLASLDAVTDALCALQGSSAAAPADAPPVSFDRGHELLAAHAADILGAAPAGRDTRVMVTMPGEAADSPQLIRELVEAGMDIMRINCAHDSPAVWERMVQHLRLAERDTGRRCKVSFDLAGPKLRTGPLVRQLADLKLPRIKLHIGDMFELRRGGEPGREAIIGHDGRVIEPAFISCALPDVFRGARVGEPILFDDGKIRGVIREASPERLRIEVTLVRGGTGKLRAEKGINLPESELALPALTAKDIEDLAFIAKHGDIVALSFVQRVSDVEALLAYLGKLDALNLGVVLKIETRAAFDRLPSLLLAALRHHSVAVMVARGDLGVEVGFERLSEVQEEILWLCEAAHVPVIWATQVLESLAKDGIPSRAEVTDAAMGSRAECVMLNKGPYMRDALRFLVDVLHRMKEHQHKKSARLRRLKVSATAGRRKASTL